MFLIVNSNAFMANRSRALTHGSAFLGRTTATELNSMLNNEAVDRRTTLRNGPINIW